MELFSSGLKRINILYVEDEAHIIEMMEKILKTRVGTLYTAKDGEEGLEKFKAHDIDIVITDIMMPKMGGLDMIRAIKEIDPKSHVVISTCLKDSDHLYEAINMGVSRYINKPVEITLLARILNELAEVINDRKDYSAALQLLNQYKYAIDSSTILSKTDKHGYITYANEAFCKLSGYSSEELMGNSHNIIRHPEMTKEVFKDLWETIRQKKIWRGVVKNLAKDGTTYIVDATIMPILDESGEIVEYIAVRHDVTELEEYKELLKSQLDKSMTDTKDKIHYIKEYEKAMNEGSLYCRMDTNCIINTTNRSFCKLLGVDADDMIGEDYSEQLSAKSCEKFLNKTLPLVKKGRSYRGVMEHRRRDGSFGYTQSTFVPIEDRENRLVEIMGIHKDITEIIELNNEIKDTQKDILVRIGDIAERRSAETGYHIKRVSEYSAILAKALGYDEEEVDRIKSAALIHDVGKLGIPDAILNKPGKLTDEEFTLMKDHTTIGYEMLKDSKRDTLRLAATIAKSHHEKWDGTGYPEGLKAEENHEAARIVALTDVFDALGSDRVYKRAWPMDEVLEFIKAQRGRHFDPNIVDKFFENIDDILSIRNTYQDVH